jgi:hypothetical protein
MRRSPAIAGVVAASQPSAPHPLAKQPFVQATLAYTGSPATSCVWTRSHA